MEWDGLNVPFIVSTAKEDKKFVRYDVFASSGFIIVEENLHGEKARYIKIEPAVSTELKVLNVYPATEADKTVQHTAYENLALKKPVTAASVEGGLVAAYAVDGNFASRWGSLQNGESWLCIDLKELKQVKGVMLYLEAAWVPYRVEYSNDNENYTTLASFGSGEVFVKLKDLDIEARYVRFIREGENWFSIYEAEIYG